MAKQTYKNPLTADEYRILLPRLGLTRAKLGKKIGKSEMTVQGVLFGHPTSHFSFKTAEKVNKAIYEEILKAQKLLDDKLKAWKQAA